MNTATSNNPASIKFNDCPWTQEMYLKGDTGTLNGDTPLRDWTLNITVLHDGLHRRVSARGKAYGLDSALSVSDASFHLGDYSFQGYFTDVPLHPQNVEIEMSFVVLGMIEGYDVDALK